MLVYYITTSAVNSKQYADSNQLNNLTVGQFISLDIETLQRNNLIHLNWLQKSIIKSSQRKFERKVAKGKIDASKKLFNSKYAPGNNNRGLVSVLLALGLATLFIWPGTLLLFGIPLSIIGLIFGIKGVKKDNSNSLAILGIVLHSIALLFFIIAIITVGFGSLDFGGLGLHF